MKIGILTFHWAANYGAVLQTYSLQEYLKKQGHEVDIINYKPYSYDLNFKYILRHPSQITNLKSFYQRVRKEKLIDLFRQKYLCLTKRVTEGSQINELGHYDVVISGSDQVLNPFFALYGDGKPSGVYFLNTISAEVRKVGYAVSFGCTEYPDDASKYAKEWVGGFFKIGVRENTGIEIVDQLGFSGEKLVVPDPVILNGHNVIKPLIGHRPVHHDYVCIYMLRRKVELAGENVVVLDDVHAALTMESWLSTIANSKALVTNSYHGMIVAILCHIPFVVDIEKGKGVGMNDRFFTLLERLELTERIVDNQEGIERLINDTNIDWDLVESKISDFRNIGKGFLECLG